MRPGCGAGARPIDARRSQVQPGPVMQEPPESVDVSYTRPCTCMVLLEYGRSPTIAGLLVLSAAILSSLLRGRLLSLGPSITVITCELVSLLASIVFAGLPSQRALGAPPTRKHERPRDTRAAQHSVLLLRVLGRPIASCCPRVRVDASRSSGTRFKLGRSECRAAARQRSCAASVTPRAARQRRR